MGVLLIIIFTPLAIALGFIVLKLAFKPAVWFALGCMTLVTVGIVVLVAAIPKSRPPATVYVPPAPPAPVTEEEKAARRAIEASGIDYPYVRAWAMIATWNKFRLEEELRLARYQKPPRTAVYREHGEFHGWRLLENLENPNLREGLVRLAGKKPSPYFD